MPSFKSMMTMLASFLRSFFDLAAALLPFEPKRSWWREPYLMRDAIGRYSEERRGNQEPSRAIKRHQAPSSAVPDAKPVLAIKSNQEQSSAIKRQQAPYRTPNQCSTMTSVSRFSYTRMSACQIRQPTIVGGNQRSAVKVRDSRALIRDSTCPN